MVYHHFLQYLHIAALLRRAFLGREFGVQISIVNYYITDWRDQPWISTKLSDQLTYQNVGRF